MQEAGAESTVSPLRAAERSRTLRCAERRNNPSGAQAPGLALIVPVYNEADNFPELIEQIEQHVPRPFVVYVVYDSDADTTLLVARALAADRPWLSLVRNDGLGVADALRTGFRHVGRGPALVVMADLSDDLAAAEPALALYRAGHRVVCPSRYAPGGRQVGGPRAKRWLSRAAGLSLRRLVGFPTHDATNNFRLYDAALVNELGIESTGGFEVALELTAKAFRRGERVAELPTTWRDRTRGQSRFRLRQWLPKYLYWYGYALGSIIPFGGDAKRGLRLSGHVCAGLLLWLSLLHLPGYVAGDALDPSYQQVLGHFLKTGAQAGSDYTFTYGPLGYFFAPVYDPDLFWHFYAWELVVNPALLVGLVWLLARQPGPAVKLVLAALMLLVLNRCRDPLYILGILTTGAMVAQIERRGWFAAALGAATLLLATVSLVKFTFFTLALFGVGFLSIHAGRRLGRWATALPAGCFAAWFLLWWLLLGQAVANLPAYLAGALEIAVGFARSMALKGDPGDVWLGLSVGAAILAVLVRWPGRAWPGWPTIAATSLLGGFLVQLWKSGFVRHDGHQQFYYAFGAVVPFLLPILFPRHDWRRPHRVALCSASVVGCVFGYLRATEQSFSPPAHLRGWAHNLRAHGDDLLAPSAVRARMDEHHRQMRERWALPEMSRHIGDAAVDVFGYGQGVALLNGWNYRPRPVFQSYSAYTPSLVAANAEFYRGPRAPEFVLFKLAPIDNRFPTLEDSATLAELLRNYRPVCDEKGFWLFRRTPTAPAAIRAGADTTRIVKFGEDVAVPEGDGGWWVTIRLRPTLRGRCMAAALKPAETHLQVWTEGDGPGTYRLPPALAEAGFLLDPLVRTTEEFVEMVGGCPSERVTAFRVVGDPGVRHHYHDALEITFRPFPLSAGD